MIEKREYDSIKATWTPSKVYASWNEIFDRLRILHKYGLRYLAKRDVIEPGANAGLAAVMISPYINSYVGLEMDKRYFDNQLIHSEKYIECPHEIHNKTFKDYIQGGGTIGNALYASFVLYHFSDEEVEVVKEHVFPKLNSFVIMNRAVDRKLNKNKYIFNRFNNTYKFLTTNGFSIPRVIWDKHKIFYLMVGVK